MGCAFPRPVTVIHIRRAPLLPRRSSHRPASGPPEPPTVNHSTNAAERHRRRRRVTWRHRWPAILRRVMAGTPASAAEIGRRCTICAENTETNDELQPALFSRNQWSEETGHVTWAK